MIKTEKIIYLQMPKTGCTYIASLLIKIAGGKQIGKRKHNALRNYNTNRLIVGSIRNPWDWYVSLWAFGCSSRGSLYNRVNGLFSIELFSKLLRMKLDEVYYKFKIPFGLWRSLYQDTADPELFRKWIKVILNPERREDLNEGFWKTPISEFAGFMTYRYARLYLKNIFSKEAKKIRNIDDLKLYDNSNNLINMIIRNESLEDDFLEVLRNTNHPIDKDALNKLKNSPPKKINYSTHKKTSFYYDDETINLVREKEKFLIDKYNYEFPG
jgi:hypothetical protein